MFSLETLKMLEGHNIYQQVISNIESNKIDFEILKEYLGDFTFEEYLKADVLVSSRVINLQNTIMMVPILDMFNHQNPS
jgi:hypothetical protein